MSNLTRQGARNLTGAIDRIASAVQENFSLLGIDPRIAKDFAYRCDLISDAVETTAVTNYPKEAGVEKEIGAEVQGPVYEEDPATSGDLKGQFTQEDFHQLTDLAEKMKTASVFTSHSRKPAGSGANNKYAASASIDNVFKEFPNKYRRKSKDGKHEVHWMGADWWVLEDLSAADLEKMWRALTWEPSGKKGTNMNRTARKPVADYGFGLTE